MTSLQLLNLVNTSHDLMSMAIRTFINYIFAVFSLRLGNRRFSLRSPFDFILPIIIGSVLSRGMNGSSSLLSTLLCSFLLVLMHWIFAYFSYKSSKFGFIVKGCPEILINDGIINWKKMSSCQISENDLLEEARHQLQINDIADIQEARLERTGRITFIRKNK